MALFYILLVLLVAAKAGGEIAKRLRQPALVGELLAGIVLGVITSQWPGIFPVTGNPVENEAFGAIADLGIFFLMLYAGIEMRPRHFKEAPGKALSISLGGFVFPFLSGVLLGHFLLPESDLKFAQTIFLAVALSITAVPIVMRALIDLNRLKSEIGKLIVSAALFDDVISLVVLAVLTAMLKYAAVPSLGSVLYLSLNIVLFFSIATAIGVLLIPRVARHAAVLQTDEYEMSFLLANGFFFALLAEFMGLHFIIGAFMAGLFFERRTLDKDRYDKVRNQVAGITTGFLAPIFFSSIGFHIRLDVITASPGFLALLIAVAFTGKLIGAGVPARLFGYSGREALFIGAGMSARGAVELVIAEVALRSGLFSRPVPGDVIVPNLFSAIVLMTLVTTIGAPILMAACESPGAPGVKRSSAAKT